MRDWTEVKFEMCFHVNPLFARYNNNVNIIYNIVSWPCLRESVYNNIIYYILLQREIRVCPKDILFCRETSAAVVDDYCTRNNNNII